MEENQEVGKEVKQKADATAKAAENAEGVKGEENSETAETLNTFQDADQIKGLKSELKGAKSGDAVDASVDWKDLYARLKADFDNYKKRAARDREDVYRYAEADILKDILPSVDNLKLALDNAKDKEDPFVKGVQLVADTLLKSLKDHGAEPFDSIGEKLDTEKMEAITMMPSADVEEGKVVAEVKKGWMLKGKVLRAAQVVVSSGKPD